MRDYEHHTIILSDDEARSGVTGHNVRYVLGFGLAGIVAAFAILNAYFHSDALSAWFSKLVNTDITLVLANLAPAILVIACATIIGAALLGLWREVSGPSENATQFGMRLRVVSQFAAICAIMAGLYLAAA